MTGEKALFVNQGFTRRIVGFKEEESELLLQFLYNHIAKVSVQLSINPREIRRLIIALAFRELISRQERRTSRERLWFG